mmetsp:Transcript_20565/g.24498  ORF Transcript_20565/g.24498 Transcript_20565/m.24498 type:complete len:280 (-) Transcript_20565:33-872(-)
MVFFSCDGCAEMLKKSSVDAHAMRCRKCESVSCVDCSVSFWGDDYRAHTSCITEAERYEKTVYKGPKKNETNRKLTPQERWMAIIRESLDTAPSSLKPYFEQIVDLDNVPRKEKQFRNFASNSLRVHGRDGDSILTSIWKHIDGVKQEVVLRKAKEDKELKAQQLNEASQEVKSKAEDDKEGENPVTISDAKNNSNNSKEANSEKSTCIVSQKLVKKSMMKTLKKHPNRQIKMKELRKILLKNSEFDKSTMKKTILQVLTDNPKKMVLDGKTITLIKKI